MSLPQRETMPHQRVHILETKGRIEIEIPFNAPPDVPTQIFVDEGTAHANRSPAIEFPAVDQYQLQGEAFSRTIRRSSNLAYGLKNAIMTMRILDALRRSETSAAGRRSSDEAL